MSKFRMSWLGSLLILWAAVPHGPLLGQAKDPSSDSGLVEVEPSYTAVDLVAGKESSVRLTFRAAVPSQKVLIEPVDFSIDRKGRISTAEVREKRYSGKSWCRPVSSEVTVHRGQDLVLDVPIVPPAGAASGEYFMGLNVTTPPSERVQPDGTRVMIQFVKLILVILRVKGFQPRFEGEILEPKVKVENFVPQFEAVFHSKSTVSVITRMTLTVRDAERKVYDGFFLRGAGSEQADGQAFLLPDNFREFSGTGNRKLPNGSYTAEFEARFGETAPRSTAKVTFEVKGSDAVSTPPLDDVIVVPGMLIFESPPAGVKFQVVEFKNRGFNPVRMKFDSGLPWVSFFPETVQIEPGKVGKVRVGFRLPPGEDPRRDLTVTLVLEGGTEKDRKPYSVAIYPPGGAPKREEKGMQSPLPQSPGSRPPPPK